MDSDNEASKQIPQRPQRMPRAIQLLNGLEDVEYNREILRKQDQFKSYQQLNKLTSQLIKKEKNTNLAILKI